MSNPSDPRPSRNLWAAIALLGLAGGVYWFVNRKTDDLVPKLVGLAAAMVGPAGFVMFLTVAFDAARYSRLKRGKGVLVRWTVPAEEWNQYIRTVGAVQGIRVIRNEPIEIVIGETGMFVGDYFQPLPHNGVLAVAPPKLLEGVNGAGGSPRMLQWQAWEAGASDSSPTEMTGVWPVPNSVPAEEVKRVMDYFEEHLGLAKQRRAAGKP